MRIIDSHFHWWPQEILEGLCDRDTYPRCDRNDRGGYVYRGAADRTGTINTWAEWFDLDRQFEHMDSLGHEVSVIGSIGPFSIYFSDLPPAEGKEAALEWNERMGEAQRRHAGRFWGSAAVPLTDTEDAIDVLNHAVLDLGLVGVNVPGSVGSDPRIDAERLEPFYARVAELDVPVFLHPTDAIFADILDGYNRAMHLSLGRVVEVSAAAARLMFSGIMERYPELRLILSHTGGALPYQSGRMDKNGKHAGLPKPPSTYLHRMMTDTVSPHMLGIKFAIDYYGIDNVMYGTDYPCWDPATCLSLIEQIELTEDQKRKLFRTNAERSFGLCVQEDEVAGVA